MVANTLNRKSLIIWLVTAALSLPAGWLATRRMAPPASDLVWAAIVFGPAWVVLRFLLGDFHWNAFFFGYLPPIVGFEALWSLGQDFGHAVALVAVIPLLAYAIMWFTTAIMFGGIGLAWLAREVSDPDRDASSLPRRFGRWLRSGLASTARWYAWWLAGAGVGFVLARTSRELAQAIGLSPGSTAAGLLSRAIVGLAGGGMTWAILRLSRPQATGEAVE